MYLLVYAVTAVRLGDARCSRGSRTRGLCYNVTYFNESVNIHNIAYLNNKDKWAIYTKPYSLFPHTRTKEYYDFQHVSMIFVTNL